MIELTRLNGHPIVVNAELLKFVEQNPDTVITLITGDKLLVREPAGEVRRRALDYRRLLIDSGRTLAAQLPPSPAQQSPVQQSPAQPSPVPGTAPEARE